MLSHTIAAFCIIDDALQAMGYKDDPQAKTPASAILTLAIPAAMEPGGKHNKALALAQDLNLFTHIPSPSRFNRSLHALYPFLLPLGRTSTRPRPAPWTPSPSPPARTSARPAPDRSTAASSPASGSTSTAQSSTSWWTR